MSFCTNIPQLVSVLLYPLRQQCLHPDALVLLLVIIGLASKYLAARNGMRVDFRAQGRLLQTYMFRSNSSSRVDKHSRVTSTTSRKCLSTKAVPKQNC
eukprot:1815768-Amphidinium_carterae.2